MLTPQRYVKTVFVYCIVIACLFFIIQQKWLIWLGPQLEKVSLPSEHMHKEINLYYWKHDQLQHETIQALWVKNRQQNIHYVINSLLTFLYEEEIIPQIITAETVILNPSESEAFISFDKKPFKKNDPIITKVHLLEAIGKSIAPLYVLQKIYFLVKHKPLEDPHIDCSIGWPV
jgi:hypothetical protein